MDNNNKNDNLNLKRSDFETTKEYINYLIYQKGILNFKTLAMFIGLIIIFGTISINLFKFVKSNNEVIDPGELFTRDYMVQVLYNAGYSYEELEEMDSDRLSSLFNKIYLKNKGQTAGKEGAAEYPEADAVMLKQEYYIKASRGEFKDIVSDFEDKKLQYSFSETYNKDLITIYNDAYYLNTIIYENSQRNDYKTTQVLANIKDPQMLLYGVVLSPEESRRDTIKDIISLSPILTNQNVRVNSVESGSLSTASTTFKNDFRFNEVASYINEGDCLIFKIDFTIDSTNLVAYIYKDMETQSLGFYGMYMPQGSTQRCDYLTVAQWQEIERNLTYGTNYPSSSNSSSSSSNVAEDIVQDFDDDEIMDNESNVANDVENNIEEEDIDTEIANQ